MLFLLDDYSSRYMPGEHGELITSGVVWLRGLPETGEGAGGGRVYLPENCKLLRRHTCNLVHTDDLLSVVYSALDGLQAAANGFSGSV